MSVGSFYAIHSFGSMQVRTFSRRYSGVSENFTGSQIPDKPCLTNFMYVLVTQFGMLPWCSAP